jgi:hypothetical protein
MREGYRDLMYGLGVLLSAVQVWVTLTRGNSQSSPTQVLIAHPFVIPGIVASLFIVAGVLPFLLKTFLGESPTHTATGQNPGQQKWCTELVKEDAKRTQERIMALTWEPHPYLTLEETNPYIDFRVTFINATVFNVKAESIEGESQYRNSPLPQRLSLINQFTLYHGESKIVLLRQHVSRETATAIQSARGVVTLDFNRIRIRFRLFHDVYLPGAPYEVLWSAPEVIVRQTD